MLPSVDMQVTKLPLTLFLSRFNPVQVLILDEVSMISAEMFHQLEHHVRIIRGVDKPFGGVQLVLSGDYYQ